MANDTQISNENKIKYIVCYSGGHSSAIAAVEIVRAFGKENVILLNHDLHPRSEDADVKRFKQEVADYLGLTVTYANMPEWDKNDQFDVCVKEKAFKYGIQSSALCTRKLKTEPFEVYLAENFPVIPGEVRPDIKVVYGFDKDERNRINRRIDVMMSKGYMTEYPLIWEKRTIKNIEEVGIRRPATYDLFNHANCKGCLKAGKQHWFAVFCLYPEIWEKAKQAEEQIGHSILRDHYLSELEPEWSILKEKNMPASEKINPQRFWAIARKLIKEDDCLPSEC